MGPFLNDVVEIGDDVVKIFAERAVGDLDLFVNVVRT
jgi:hypothetical protein